MMKAVRISKTGGREVLQLLRDVAIPKPTGSQVVVKNSYVGINFIDTYFREGLYPHPLPMTLGKEGAGVVVASGPEAIFEEGDRVVYSASSGAYAQFTLVDTTAIVQLPEDISEKIAAASFIQGLTAITLIEETYKVQKGDTALVHAAAGGMGTWLTQLLNLAGVTVIATASTQDKLNIAKANGAHHLINYSVEDVEAKVKAIVPAGVDVVYDGVGKSTFDLSLACLRRKGFFASFGNASGPPPPFSLMKLAPKCIKIARPQLFGYLVEPEEIQYFTEKLFQSIRAGVRVSIYKEYDIETVAQAHEDLEGRLSSGKLLLRLADHK